MQSLLHSDFNRILSPNILVLGFRHKWRDDSPSHLHMDARGPAHLKLMATSKNDAELLEIAKSMLLARQV